MPSQSFSPLEQQLINQLQVGLPVSERPFDDIAKQCKVSENEVITCLQNLLDTGILTRFGPMFDAACLGGAFTLAAMEVPEDQFENVTNIVNSFDQVAHNYKREHQLNMWFVVGTEQADEINEVLGQIEQKSGLPVFNMPKEEEFYVGLYLPV